jgi:hypothetical protein
MDFVIELSSLGSLTFVKDPRGVSWSPKAIKETPQSLFSSPLFELLLCCKKFSHTLLLLPHYTHFITLGLLGATSCPRIYHFLSNKRKLWRTSWIVEISLMVKIFEVMLFLAHGIDL